MYPDSIKDLINSFKGLPGIGEKTAERLVFSLINYDKNKLTLFSDNILKLRDNIKFCSKCGNISEDSLCPVCLDEERNKKVIFIVERPKDIILFEKIGIFNGVYHVLNGLISPMDGVGPADINLDSLIERISKDDVKELIFGLRPSIEGETTMQYIKKLVEKFDIKISKIATGIPIGTDIEYIDSLTLELALDERKNIN